MKDLFFSRKNFKFFFKKKFLSKNFIFFYILVNQFLFYNTKFSFRNAKNLYFFTLGKGDEFLTNNVSCSLGVSSSCLYSLFEFNSFFVYKGLILSHVLYRGNIINFCGLVFLLKSLFFRLKKFLRVLQFNSFNRFFVSVRFFKKFNFK